MKQKILIYLISSKIEVWACIFGDEIVESVILIQNLTGDNFVDILEYIIEPLIFQALECQIDGKPQ